MLTQHRLTHIVLVQTSMNILSRSGIGVRCCREAQQTLCVHLHHTKISLDIIACVTCLREFEITSWPPSWKCDVISEIRLRQSMRIYFTWGTILSNFIPIRYKATEP